MTRVKGPVLTPWNSVRAEHVVFAACVIALGALSSLWVAKSVLGLVAIFGLVRICWLEDNILGDLFGRRIGPEPSQIRRHFLMRWFGVWIDAASTDRSVQIVATAMRAEVHLWTSLLVSMGAAMVALQGPFSLPVDLSCGLILFLVALTRADRLAVSIAHCETGQALPDHLLLPRSRRDLAQRGR